MTPSDALGSLPDDELLVRVQRLTARSNVALADLLAYLGEVEARGIHRTRACASLYTYCIYELRMSEDAAFRRAKAARFVREYPELRDALAKGELHLTGVLTIGPHLGGERHEEIVRRARFRSKRELLQLVAEIDPRPAVPATIEPIGPERAGAATPRAYVESLSGPVRELPRGQRPEDWTEEGTEEEECDPTPRRDEPAAATLPERPLQYRVEFTANQEFVDLLHEACDLLSHESPRPALPDVQLRALRALVKQLRARKRAGTDRPRSGMQEEEGARGASVAGGTAPARVTAPCAAPEREATGDAAPARVTVAAPERVTDAPCAAPERVLLDPSATRAGARYIPAAVRRTVWDRDGARCAYVDNRGERCRETSRVEVHHRHARALGGPATADNLELRCRAHNTLAAEQDFGRDYIDWARGVLHDAQRLPAASMAHP